jgi:hypothetical protein
MKDLFSSTVILLTVSTGVLASSFVLDFSRNDNSLDRAPAQPVLMSAAIPGGSSSPSASGGISFFDLACVGFSPECMAGFTINDAPKRTMMQNVLVQQAAYEAFSPGKEKDAGLINLVRDGDVELVSSETPSVSQAVSSVAQNVNPAGSRNGFSVPRSAKLGASGAGGGSTSGVVRSSDLQSPSFGPGIAPTPTALSLNEAVEAFDEDVDVDMVPVPAGLPLLAGGLGLFAFLRRRKKS